jgi:glycogen debranching enzyme
VRCNQVFALSLTHPVLKRDLWLSVVRVLEEKLLTPMGLRTLAPGSEGYRPTYGGNQAGRDSAYHQGTVWPWLIGPFVTAYVRANRSTSAARKRARQMLDGIEQHLGRYGVGQVCEVADADPPHAPGGCPAQAWSVAEVLRALYEDIHNLAPQP